MVRTILTEEIQEYNAWNNLPLSSCLFKFYSTIVGLLLDISHIARALDFFRLSAKEMLQPTNHSMTLTSRTDDLRSGFRNLTPTRRYW